ncbi:winged helix-turn-helix transcriptional regulator [Kitasatospora sp. NBC_00458]|uniref:winged helix-turn-helix transcriptional regulator n=1 Tax=Kitasatospora sp. NBC_00458 TaxID=2903568 RepID=UPI002E196770
MDENPGGTYLADCRARAAFDLLANTWSPVLLWALRDAPQRPGVLRARIGGISAKVLTENLRRLEHNGLVERCSHPGSPPRVEYGLTPLGRTLLPALETLGDWGARHGEAVLDAQDRAAGDEVR